MPKQKVMHGQLIEASFSLFRVFGFRGTSIQDIANEVGITKASIYYYFPSKEEILIGAIDYAVCKWNKHKDDDWDDRKHFLFFLIKMRFEMEDDPEILGDLKEKLQDIEKKLSKQAKSYIFDFVLGVGND